MRHGLARTIIAAVSALPSAAFAHTGLGDAHVHGFAHGFWHPLGGLDHVLAMVTVGIFAWQLGGRAIDEASAKVKVSPDDELLLQASGGTSPAPASSPGASAAAGTVASDATPTAAPPPGGAKNFRSGNIR